MTKPADKWMQKAREIVASQWVESHAMQEQILAGKFDTELTQIMRIARALEAADKAATERAAQIAENVFPNGKLKAQNAAFCAGNIIAAAIRKGTDNGQG